MHIKEQETHLLQAQINEIKANIKEAIRDGFTFEEVQSLALQLKEQEKQLQDLRNIAREPMVSKRPD